MPVADPAPGQRPVKTGAHGQQHGALHGGRVGEQLVRLDLVLGLEVATPAGGHGRVCGWGQG
eukprot:366395-Chlamydomonas_euryale.AAC.17